MVEQEDIRRERHLVFTVTTVKVKQQLMATMHGDGLLITYGNPRQHIWIYAAGFYDNATNDIFNCPCAADTVSPPPSFVGTNYYCESGAADTQDYNAYYFNDPLWDGSGCIISKCCNDTT